MTRIVHAYPPKRTRKPKKAGPKVERVIVGKVAEPESPEAYKARGDAADKLMRDLFRRATAAAQRSRGKSGG